MNLSGRMAGCNWINFSLIEGFDSFGWTAYFGYILLDCICLWSKVRLIYIFDLHWRFQLHIGLEKAASQVFYLPLVYDGMEFATLSLLLLI